MPTLTLRPAGRRPSGALLLLLSVCVSCGGDAAPPPASGPTPDAPEATPASSPGAPRGGALEQEEDGPEDLPGRWHRRRAAETDGEAPTESAIAGLGYSGAYGEGGDEKGVTVLDRDRMQPGHTLFCSGHAPSVLLIDADGRAVHEWAIDYDEVFPGELPFPGTQEHREFVRRAHPFPNGDLLVVFEYIGIARVDRDGSPIWAQALRHHHDVQVQEDGTIVTLTMTQLSPKVLEREYGVRLFPKGVADNQVVFLTPEGVETRRISILEAFHGSDHARFLASLPRDNGDIFHANSVAVLDEDTAEHFPHFDAGDILVSMRTPSALFVIDGEDETVKWLATGVWRQQHQASWLDSGRILLLDNCGGNGRRPLNFNRSRVLEWDPAAHRIAWQYPARDEHIDFFTHYLGYVERLDNGNTLVTESTQGRLFEVTPEGDVVWEFVSPFRAGEDDELITTIMGGKRIQPAAAGF